MYIPAHFSDADIARARALIESNSFGTLVVPCGDGVPEIAHIPFLIDAEPTPFGTLRAHVARANPLASLLASPRPVVAVFTGPHAYVTPRWYETPRANVPTWNFTAVHAHGVALRIDDREDVRRALSDLTAKHEGGAAEPWTVAGADAAYIEKLVGGIVAFTIRIERLQSKRKLSQNRSAVDRAGVVRGLRERSGPDDATLARMIEEDGRDERTPRG